MSDRRRNKWDVPGGAKAGPPGNVLASVQEAANRIAARLGGQVGAGEGFLDEVDINDIHPSKRQQLTKSSLQKEIFDRTGATVATKGRYCGPNGTLPAGEKPLYLQISADSKSKVDDAVDFIQNVLRGGGRQGFGSGPPARFPPAPQALQPPPPPRSPNECNVVIPIQDARYNAVNAVAGPGGSYLSHIQLETNTDVVIRGVGASVAECGFGEEMANTQIHINITGKNAARVEEARVLSENLIATVVKEYRAQGGVPLAQYAAQNQPPPPPPAAAGGAPPPGYPPPPPSNAPPPPPPANAFAPPPEPGVTFVRDAGNRGDHGPAPPPGPYPPPPPPSHSYAAGAPPPPPPKEGPYHYSSGPVPIGNDPLLAAGYDPRLQRELERDRKREQRAGGRRGFSDAFENGAKGAPPNAKFIDVSASDMLRRVPTDPAEEERPLKMPRNAPAISQDFVAKSRNIDSGIQHASRPSNDVHDEGGGQGKPLHAAPQRPFWAAQDSTTKPKMQKEEPAPEKKEDHGKYNDVLAELGVDFK